MARRSSTIRPCAHGPSARCRPHQCGDRSAAARAPRKLARGVSGRDARGRRIGSRGGGSDPDDRRGRREPGPARSNRAGHRRVVGSDHWHVPRLAAGGGTSRGARWGGFDGATRDVQASRGQQRLVRPVPPRGRGGVAMRTAARGGGVRTRDGRTSGPEADPPRLRVRTPRRDGRADGFVDQRADRGRGSERALAGRAGGTRRLALREPDRRHGASAALFPPSPGAEVGSAGCVPSPPT